MDTEEKHGNEGTTTNERSNLLVRGWNAYTHGLGKLVSATSSGNKSMGQWTSRMPMLMLLITAVVTAGSCCGWAKFTQESSADVLWVPQTGKARDDTDYVNQYYPKSKQGASFYASLKPMHYERFGGNNALQIPVTWEMFQLHASVMAIAVTDDASGVNVTFADLCYRTSSGGCSKGSYLNYWSMDFATFVASVGGSVTDPAVGNDATFRAQVSKITYPDGGAVSLLSVFGGTMFEFDPKFRLTAAQVIASDYTLDKSVSDATAKKWHRAFKDVMTAKLPTLTYMTADFITGSTVGDELTASITNDMFLVIISLIIFIIIAVMLLSKTDSVMTRTSLALLGVLVTALGIFAGWGWGFIFGMPFTPLQQLSPFILLGMGIDVIFILVKAYDIIIHREPELTLEQAFGKLLATAGLGVQVTLFASAVAFALGAVSNLNSVRWFSAFATLNTLGIMILMTTMFIAFFVLTERRIAAEHRDCCCCTPCARKKAPATHEVALSPVTNAPVDVTVTLAAHAPQVLPPVSHEMMGGKDVSSASDAASEAHTRPVNATEENVVKYLFRVYYAPALTRWYVKLAVIAAFVAYAIVCFFGIYNMKYGQPLSDLAPDGSYLQAYDKMSQSTYAQQVGQPTGVYFRDLDFSDPIVQGKMLRSLDMVLSNKFINASTSGFQGNWYITFNQYAANQTTLTQAGGCTNPYFQRATGNLAGVINPTAVAQQIQGCVPKDQYYPLLAQFLSQSKSAGYRNDIIMRNGVIVTARMTVMQVASAGNDKYNAEYIHSIRPLERDINSDILAAEDDAAGNYVLFTWNSNYRFCEGDAMLPDMALEYFVLALVGVGFVMLLMLVNPWASLLIMCAVGIVDLYLFGELWILGIRFNQVSVINMIMATGLAVDYSVYFAQKFMTVEADGTRNGRMQQSLSDTGSAVFLGGMTALCGTVPMAFSKSVIIRTFFKLIFGTILFSLLVGLLLLPVVFSLVGPPPIRSALVVDAPPPPPQQQHDTADGAKLGDGHAGKGKEGEDAV